jgi:glycosyltransferase involved in cell wall biosynthesis
MSYRFVRIRILLEQLFCLPIVLLGRVYGFLFPLGSHHGVIIFSSSADIGGSIRVNAELAACMSDFSPLVIFTKRPKNRGFSRLFIQPGVKTLDLYRFIDNKLYHFLNVLWRGILSEWIRQSSPRAVIGGECIYFYKVIPYLNRSIRRIEICHLNTWINYSIAFEREITFRVFSTQKIRRDVIRQYEKNNFPSWKYSKLLFADNFIDLPPYKAVFNSRLEVLFVGRGAPQKRIHLIGEIALYCKQLNLPIHFSFVGDVADYIPFSLRDSVTLHGAITDADKIASIYQSSDILILTSAFEGLPLVVMEMMSRGKVVLSTAVDGIPDYIKHNYNGLLIFEKDEQGIISQGVELLKRIELDRSLLAHLGKQARLSASEQFSKEKFVRFYRSLVLECQ